MKKVAFYTLGCKLNFSETSAISRSFADAGFIRTDFTDTPDIFVINTCSVTENADRKCRKVVREARAISPDAFIAIVGCYAQLKPAEISGIPGVDAVLGAAEKFRLVELLGTFDRTAGVQVLASPVAKANTFNSSFSSTERTRMFLKVQDGCDYNCSFCTIPLARGASRSGTIEGILSLARGAAETGIHEIVLTGVNTGDFGHHPEGSEQKQETFHDLVKALDEVEGIERFRISSIEPNLLTDSIIETVASSKRFAPHFHIPLQSGSDKILKLMRRRYLRDRYASRVKKIKELMPHCCIGADVMTGFPGETKADFLETYEFLNGLDISYLHVFTYSERANTAAAAMENAVPRGERSERTAMLHILSDKKRRAFYDQNTGRVSTVIFENDIENGMMHGFTENYIRVAAPYDPLMIYEKAAVRLEAVDGSVMRCSEPLELART